jgi:NDP-sugar pyrophosphorylase family protein
MVPVAGRPLLEWILIWLKRNRIKRVILGVAYRKERIIDYFDCGGRLGLQIEYSVHTVEGGTAEGFRLAISRFVDDETFLAMNADELTNIKLSRFYRYHKQEGGLATIAVGPLRSPFGIVQLSGNSITGFKEKPIIQTHLVSIGTYMFEHSILNYLPKTGNVEQTTFPSLARQRKLKAYLHNGFWATVNTVKDLVDVENQLRQAR